MARTKAKDKEAADILARQSTALDLRKQGLSYRKIGERLKVSHEQARQDVEGMLTQLAALNRDKGEEFRALKLEQLDTAIEGVMPFVQAGSASHTAALTSVIEKQSKIAGILSTAEITININIDVIQRFEQVAKEAGIDPAQALEEYIQQIHALKSTVDAERGG